MIQEKRGQGAMVRLRVKEVAQAKKMSMNKLSQRSEVSYHVIQDIYKNPYRIVTTDTLNRLAATLGVPVTELIEDVPDGEVSQA
jgi:DNA-binding Xre family transcriptional regulator